MNPPLPYPLLADAVLILHAALVLFVVGGLALIVAGNLRGWGWVNGRIFRFTHLAAILVVAGEAWLGAACPLTTLEMVLRARAGDATHAGGFIQYWLQRLLYHDAPGWVFTVAYTVFALIVLACWRAFPPRRRP